MTNFSRKVVRFQLRIERGSANWLSRAVLSLKRQHDSFVRCTALGDRLRREFPTTRFNFTQLIIAVWP
ncbi:MAG TPA: hypothetical protein VKD72_32840 [Gemmataceae bacterium]|nr:hypothetical protein [Gemmataceae bacterium]